MGKVEEQRRDTAARSKKSGFLYHSQKTRHQVLLLSNWRYNEKLLEKPKELNWTKKTLDIMLGVPTKKLKVL